MIDVESQIYTPIAEALRAQFPGILVSGEYVNAPTRFPYVSLVEQDMQSLLFRSFEKSPMPLPTLRVSS